MERRMYWGISLVCLTALLVRPPTELRGEGTSRVNDMLSVVVMDPLARPLSCACVEGYAQRDYEQLAEYLRRKTDCPVRLTFAESLKAALKGKAAGRADLVIGKDSVVRADCREAKIKSTRLGLLTDKAGNTTQKGLIVVAREDPAKAVGDLAGYRILFGPASCDEKHAAPIALLRKAGIPVPGNLEISGACSDGACKVVELGPTSKTAAVISSYAVRLLEGCGTIKKGDLRIIAETEAVPFIAAYATDSLSQPEREIVRNALLSLMEAPEVCDAIESLIGFVPAEDRSPREIFHAPAERNPAGGSIPKELSKNNLPHFLGPPVVPLVKGGQFAESYFQTVPKRSSASNGWPQWRGPNRDGLVPQLPATLPSEPNIIWRHALGGSGLSGIAATDKYVVFGDRNLCDTHDLFRCLRAGDGTLLWKIEYEAAGKMDYGSSPRATPLIQDDLVFCLGAFGDLTCADLATGLVFWRKNIRDDFGADFELIWGTTSSPLMVDGRLIVNPGASNASLVALDPITGDAIWKTPGRRHAYASFTVATLGGKRQIVGYDRESLGGWDIATGRRLWELKPDHDHDFNVPTPVVIGDRLFIATENNGARLHAFSDDGRIVTTPIATHEDLAPDMSSAVVVGGRLFCVLGALYCLDPGSSDGKLNELWIGEDDAFPDYAPIIGGKDRLLILGLGGQLLLVDARSDRFHVISRLAPLGNGDEQLYAHPAMVGTRLFLRGETEMICLELGPQR